MSMWDYLMWRAGVLEGHGPHCRKAETTQPP
nr:MAG TPA_asm: hypothetical protein [Caudoviricetes sp.]